MRLPCKVGTIIYKIENNTDACCKCNDFKISYCDDDLCSNKNGHDEGGVFYVLNPQYADKPLCKKQFYEIKEYEMKTIDEIFWRRNDFCKTVFFTRKEAEDKLAEMLSVVSQHCVVYLSDHIDCRHSRCESSCKSNIKKWLQKESEE